MKIICIGRNYISHVLELQNQKPKEPVLFLKPDTSILQKGQPFFIPHFTNDIHFEVEVLVKINKLESIFKQSLLKNIIKKLV